MTQRESPDRHRFRGWIRASKRHTEKMQRAALEPLCGAIYSADDPDGWSDLIHSLRQGNAVVVTTLGRLAGRWADLTDALREVHAKRSVVVETTTGRRSDDAPAAIEMLDAARSDLLGEVKALTPATAKKAAKKRWGKHKRKRMPIEEAAQIWHAHKGGTNTERQARMWGWSSSAIYRHKLLGPRGVVAGRPRAKRK